MTRLTAFPWSWYRSTWYCSTTTGLRLVIPTIVPERQI
jgi:hypothetical protein